MGIILRVFYIFLYYMSELIKQLRPDKNLSELKSLYTKPKHEVKVIEQPSFQVFKSGLIAQADLLYLPEDKLDNDKKIFCTLILPFNPYST